MEEKGMSEHTLALKSLCRVCGGKVRPVKKRRAVYACTEHEMDLKNAFGIDVKHDKPTLHQPQFCHICKVKTYNNKVPHPTKQSHGSLTVTPHVRLASEHATLELEGGRPRPVVGDQQSTAGGRYTHTSNKWLPLLTTLQLQLSTHHRISLLHLSTV
jgi:hypothetical protein